MNDVVNFSVVVPLFNKELSIANTIQSILDQTYKRFEVLIVNDGSTDQSIQVVSCFTDNRIRIINKNNGGVSSARNRGICEAKYEWIAFIDGDDLWAKNYLSNVLAMIKKYPLARIIGHAFQFDNKRNDTCFNKEGYIEEYHKISFFKTILTASSVVINKKCFESVEPFRVDISYGEDIELWSRLSKFFVIAFSPSRLVIYNLSSENRAGNSLNRNSQNWYSLILNVDNIDDWYEKRYKLKTIGQAILDLIKRKQYGVLRYLLRKHSYYVILQALFIAIKFKINQTIKLLIYGKDQVN